MHSVCICQGNSARESSSWLLWLLSQFYGEISFHWRTPDQWATSIRGVQQGGSSRPSSMCTACFLSSYCALCIYFLYYFWMCAASRSSKLTSTLPISTKSLSELPPRTVENVSYTAGCGRNTSLCILYVQDMKVQRVQRAWCWKAQTNKNVQFCVSQIRENYIYWHCHFNLAILVFI